MLYEANQVIAPPQDAQGALDRMACDMRHLNQVEQPLLLHPALDDPKEHLQFLPTGAKLFLSFCKKLKTIMLCNF